MPSTLISAWVSIPFPSRALDPPSIIARPAGVQLSPAFISRPSPGAEARGSRCAVMSCVDGGLGPHTAGHVAGQRLARKCLTASPEARGVGVVSRSSTWVEHGLQLPTREQEQFCFFGGVAHVTQEMAEPSRSR